MLVRIHGLSRRTALITTAGWLAARLPPTRVRLHSTNHCTPQTTLMTWVPLEEGEGEGAYIRIYEIADLCSRLMISINSSRSSSSTRLLLLEIRTTCVTTRQPFFSFALLGHVSNYPEADQQVSESIRGCPPHDGCMCE